MLRLCFATGWDNDCVGIRLKVSGNDSGTDRLFASVAGRRFPAPVSVTNTGSTPVQVELQIREGSGAKVRIANPRLKIGPGATADTTLEADTPSLASGDTTLEALVDGMVQAEFRLTVVSLARESVFHNLVPHQS